MNPTNKKANVAQQYVSLAAELLRVAEQCDNLVAGYFAEGFNAGPNTFGDADFDTGPNTQLTAAKITAFITAMQAVQSALPAGVRDNLRKMLTSGLP
jgi:hypothetical protein